MFDGRSFVFGLLVLVVLASVQTAAAATISEVQWENAITDPGLEFIAGYNVTVNASVLTNSGNPFTLSSYTGTQVDTLTVTAKFIDDYGNAIDVTGDGVADIFSFTESATPGLWIGTIQLGNITPGLYKLKIEAIAQNATTGTIYDNATAEYDVWIAGGPYWISKADVKDGDSIEIAGTTITIRGLSDLGAILDLGEMNTQTITDSDRDGFFTWKYDISADGVDDWIVFSKSEEEDTFTLLIYSTDVNLLDKIENKESIVRAKEDKVRYTNRIFKNYNTYKAYIAWDESLLAKLGIKAVDYYIIPLRGSQHWKEGWGAVERTDVKVIKRVTYLGGLFGSEEEVFSGNIFNKNVNIDDIITVFGKFTGNWYRIGGAVWEIMKGLGDITLPNTYSLRARNINELAVSSEDWRGFNPVLNPEGRGAFKPSIDWENLLGEETLQES